MKISALIPTYNRRVFVPRAIRSVLAQTLPVDEIIVVDDGSTDGTAEEIQREFGSSVRVVVQPNAGVSGARRRAIVEAIGDWVAFLDSDDEWTPKRTQVFAQAVEKVPGTVAWIFGNTEEICDSGAPRTQFEKLGLNVVNTVHVFEDALDAQYPWQFGPLQSSLIRRDALVNLGCFSDDLRDSEDRLTGIQVACSYGCAAVPDIVTKLYRTSDLSATSLVFKRDSLGDLNQWADYYRAGMKGFSIAAEKVNRQKYGELYADAVRGMCHVLARRGQDPRILSREQFRYCVSIKSIAFYCAALTGSTGLASLKAISKFARSTQRPRTQSN